jgi:hypothetical protein
MLASTVQFSTNDQSPATRTDPGTLRGSHSLRTQQRARHPASPVHRVPHTPKSAVPATTSIHQMPNNQRSTHERPGETSARNRPCAP